MLVKLKKFYSNCLNKKINFKFPVLKRKKKKKFKADTICVMGKKGVGKSTYLTLMARKYLKMGIPVWSNIEIKGCYKLDIREDLNVFLLEEGVVIIDEAGFEFNSRDFNDKEYKKHYKNLYRFISMHRHYNLKIYLAVQFWSRLDISIRELLDRIVVMEPTIFFWCVRSHSIGCKIDINKDSKQIEEQFKWISMLFGGVKYNIKYFAYKYFDSYYQDLLKPKTWLVWGTDTSYEKVVTTTNCDSSLSVVKI